MKNWKQKIIKFVEHFIMVLILLIIILYFLDEQFLKEIIKSYKK